jgi:pimeloyl-ACP methyl ester carboxylesterase
MLPIVLLLLLAAAAISAWIVISITRPPRGQYLVTPQTFSQLSGPVLKATDETWSNRDGTRASGWLIRGAPGAPAVILYHRYGADRSWLLNLSVKLNEATNFTVLWPDLRGHGPNPTVKWTSLGPSEGEDAGAAIDYVRSLKTPSGEKQTAEAIGLYGVELGAYAALAAAANRSEVRALVLDSISGSPDEMVNATSAARSGMDNRLLRKLARLGMRAYFFGKFQNSPSCGLAASLRGKRLLLLSGADAGYLRNSTMALERCLSPEVTLETKTDLPLSGLNLPSATGQAGEGYDRRVIEFFDTALRNAP